MNLSNTHQIIQNCLKMSGYHCSSDQGEKGGMVFFVDLADHD